MAQRRKPTTVLKEESMIGGSDGSEDELKNVGDMKKGEHQQTRNLKEWCTSFSSNESQQPLGLSKSETKRKSPCVSPTSGESTLGSHMEVVCGASEETSSNGNKDEEDDDNEDENEDDKIDAHYDPERLKAFNMFVRLFVDENLDRIVPISKQPKEKIQAIIDACARQFPEFAERTRKRIRTYLKSCRRNKRTRDSNGWENSRPTPPHLTSIQAEQILATACENEAQNAKRMRLGLEPVSQSSLFSSQSSISQTLANSDRPLVIDSSPSKGDADTTSNSTNNCSLGKSFERVSSETKSSNVHNNAGLFSSSYQTGFSKSPLSCNTIQNPPNTSSIFLPGATGLPSSTSPTVSTPASSSGSLQMISNGPTDLSLKGTTGKSSTTARPSLNPIEIAAVRQLITGYRESAAFLLRSADELENLLNHQQST